MIISSFVTVALLLFSLLFAYVSHHICLVLAAAPLIFYLAIPIRLNSLDREGARLLSPCDSQITITPDAGPDDSAPGDAYELK